MQNQMIADFMAVAALTAGTIVLLWLPALV